MAEAIPTDRTSLAGILRLPDELLGEVCVQVMQMQTSLAIHEEEEEYAHSISFYNWLKATHVCKRWRNVALSTPRLWARVKLTNIECFAAQLSRAGSVPLSVMAGYAWNRHLSVRNSSEGHPILPLAELLWCNMHRVESLVLSLSSPLCEALSTIKTYSALGAPMLKSLNLVSVRPLHWSSAIPILSSCPLPNLTFVRCGATDLDVASMRDFLRPTITRLEVSLESSSLTIAAWIGVLRTLPNLVQLTLFDVVDRIDTQVFQAPPPSCVVCLPKLLELSFTGHTSSAFVAHLALLAHIETPRSPITHLSNGTELGTLDLEYMWAVLSHKTCDLLGRESSQSGPLQCILSCNQGYAQPRDRIAVTFGPAIGTTMHDEEEQPSHASRGGDLPYGMLLVTTGHSNVDTFLESLYRSHFPLGQVIQLSLLGTRLDLHQKVLTTSQLQQVLRLFTSIEILFVGPTVDHNLLLRALEDLLDEYCAATPDHADDVDSADDAIRGVLPELRSMGFMTVPPCAHYDPALEPAHPSSSTARGGETLANRLIRVLGKWSICTRSDRILKSVFCSSPLMPNLGDLAGLKASGTVQDVLHGEHYLTAVCCVQCVSSHDHGRVAPQEQPVRLEDIADGT